MTEYYLGIDGGGTKTRATIIDSNGAIVGHGVGASSNVNNLGKGKATLHVKETVALAAAQAGIDRHSFKAVFLGIAGVVSDSDRNDIFEIATQLNLASAGKIGIDHDARIALAGGLAGQPGIVQIVGTGTSCFGINAQNERWLAGGWGYLVTDEGGGYWLGLQAIKAAAAHADGRGEPTMLTEMVREALELNAMREVMNRLYTQHLSVTEIAALSRLVIAAAQNGDNVTIDIIARGMEEVARCVVAVAQQLKFAEDDTHLVLIGGMTQAGDVLTKPLKAAIHRHLPQCNIHQPQFEAAIGAAILAYQQDGGVVDAQFIDKIKTSLSL